MTPQSAKAKGRRLVLAVRDALLKSAPELHDSDIFVPAGSQPGADLHLSKKAIEIYPYAFEMKNVEKINIWEAIQQAKTHTTTSGLQPLVVFKRNNTETYACLDFEHLLELIRGLR